MAQDLATLGLQVETSGIRAGTQALEDLRRAGNAAADALNNVGDNDLNDNLEDLADNLEDLADNTDDLTDNLEDVAESGDLASDSLNGMNNNLTASQQAFNLAKTAAVGFAGAALFTDLIETARQFETSMLNVQSKLMLTDEGMAELEATAKHLGATTSYSASQAADAMGFLAQAGLNAGQIVGAMPATLNIASAASIDLAAAADIATNAMGGFGLKVSDLEMVGDIMVMTSNKANTSFEELDQVFKVAAGTAKSFGLSIADVSAAAGHLANQGLKGSEAGTALRNMILRLVNPAGDSAKALKELGLSTEDFFKTMDDGEVLFRGFPNMIDQLAESSTNAKDMTRIFGAEVANAALNMRGGSEVIRELTGAIQVQGAAADAAALKSSGLDGAFGLVASSWEAAKISFMDQGGTEAVTKGLNSLAYALGFLPTLFEEVGSYVDAFTDRMGELSLKLSDAMTDLSETGFAKATAKIEQKVRGMGINAVKGLVAGINATKNLVTGASKNVAEEIPKTIESELAIRSPSRRLMETGFNAGLGISEGIKKSQAEIKKAAKAATDAARATFDRLTDSIELQYIRLTQGDEPARRYELSMQGIVGTNADIIISGESVVNQLKEAEGQREEEARVAIDLAEEKKKALQKQADAEQKAIDETKAKREKANKAVEAARVELDLTTKAQSVSTEEMRAARLELVDGYTPALAAEQAALEASTKAIIEKANKQRELDDGVKALEKSQKLHNVTMLDGEVSARAAELAMQGYSVAQAENMAETEANMATQQSFYDGLVENIKSAESVKDFFSGLGDWIKDWLKEKIAHFAANKIMAYVGVGGAAGAGGFSIDSLLSNFTGGGAGAGGGAGGGGSLFGGDGGGLGGIASAAAPAALAGGVGYMVGDFLGAGSPEAMGILSGIGMAVAGPIGAVVGGLVGSLFGGSKEKTGEGVRLGYSSESGFDGQQVERFEKTKSFWRGTDRWSEYQDLDSEVEDNIALYFDNMTTSVNGFSKALGYAGENILDGFEVGTVEFTGDDVAERTEKWLMDSTLSAYENAFNKLDPEIQRAIDSTGSMFGEMVDVVPVLFGRAIEEFSYQVREGTASVEEIEARFIEVTKVASYLAPALENLGFQIGDTFEQTVFSSTMLSDAMGGADAAIQRLNFYTTNFVPTADIAGQIIDAARLQLETWNATLETGNGNIIDSRDEFTAYMTTLDLTTEAGRNAAAAAFEQMEALILVSDANAESTLNLNTVAEAARNLNLNFSETSPLAIGASNALIELMGGIDSFTQSSQTYYDLFYTQSEKQELALVQAALAVKDYNEIMGLSGDATIDTDKEFRNMVESLDLTTEKGRTAYAASMDVAESMRIIADEGENLEDIINDLPSELTGAFELMQTSSDNAADDMKEAYTEVDTAITDAAGAMGELSTAISDMGAVAKAEKEAADKRAADAAREAQAAADAADAADAAASAATSSKSSGSTGSTTSGGSSDAGVGTSGYTASTAGNAVLASGGSLAAAIAARNSQGNVSAFANGGDYKGGLALVGEEGAELINFNTGGHISTASDTARMLGNDNHKTDDLVQTIIELKNEVKRIGKQQIDVLMQQINQGNALVQGNSELIDHVNEGNRIAERKEIT